MVQRMAPQAMASTSRSSKALGLPTKRPRDYDHAVAILIDLRALG